MNLALPSVSDDESEATQRLHESAKTANADPALLAFFEALYRNAAPEDINRYTPDALAALARLVFARLGRRKPGESYVDLFNPRTKPGNTRTTNACSSRSMTTCRSCSIP